MLRARSASRRFAVVALLLGSALGSAHAPARQARQGADEPWPADVVGTLRSFFERVDVESVLAGVTAPVEAPVSDTPASVSARLPDTLQAPFRYVQGATRHHAYAGNQLGARGVLLAGGGNSLDRSLLLRDLYSARGVESRLVRGRLRWADAVELVGPEPADLDRGDPWLRRVELASDHWWVEVRDRDRWIALDPSFRDSDWGEARGRARSAHDRVPADLRATIRVEISGARGPLSRAEVGLEEVVGLAIEVVPLREDAPAALSGDATPDGAHPATETSDGEAIAPMPRGEAASGDLVDAPDALDRYLEAGSRPAAGLRVLAGGRELDVPWSAQAGAVVLTLEVVRPFARAERITVPLDPGRGDTVTLLAHTGDAAAALASAGRPVYRLLRELAAAEATALQAWTERPRPEDEASDRPPAVVPPSPEPAPRRAEPLDGEVALHPARALQLAALEAWRDFHRTAPRAVGVAMLAAADRLRGAVASHPPPARLVVVRWTPPGTELPGGFAVWSRDSYEPLGADVGGVRGVRAAAGFLHSALLGQVLHSVADAAPVTAFDLTLRSVGLGQRLAWWSVGDALPEAWPESARRTAESDRDDGGLLVGPADSVGFDEVALYGWWAVDGPSGATRGRVVRRGEVAEAAVDVAAVLDAADLESVLASLPDLQHATRWLVGAATPSTGMLADLLPRACAATALVGDLLVAGAPSGFAPPQFAPYCAGAAPAAPSSIGPAPAAPSAR